LASSGWPDPKIVFIFLAGLVLMRSAGCAINDFADRHFDGHVERTRTRPLASGKITSTEALLLAGLLAFSAFLLVLQCNRLTIYLAFIGAALACIYPFLKRITHLPQLGLGLAFTWGVPMAFAAETNTVSKVAWILFLTGLIWPLIYDTMYAMVDKADDVKIGVKSTAILFNQWDKWLIGLLQILFIVMLILIGYLFHLHFFYDASLVLVMILFIYQQWLIKDRNPQKCFSAFLNNNWVGLIIFVGILTGL
jgi:4-hydroxybenzoate polyprenyltransferase